MLRLAYRLSARAASRLPFPRDHLARSLAGRRAAEARWRTWAQQGRREGPLVWVHGASVGESLAATPIVERLRSTLPQLQVVHSFSSPSVADWPAPFPRAFADFLPLDEPGPMGRVLDSVRPSLVLLVRGDIWPEMLWQTSARRIPVALAGATVRPGSLRLRFPLSRLYADTLRSVSWVGTTTEDDARRLARLGAPEPCIEHTGDPRHDQVLERLPDITRIRGLEVWATAGPTLVAGSVEPDDDPVLLEAAAKVLRDQPNARLLVVPHRPEGAAAERFRARATSAGLEAAVWAPGAAQAPTERCLIVNARGLLFDLYTLGTAAYVGGGFQRGRLHATIEPAAFGLPVLFGPRWRDSPDAAALVASGGAVSLDHAEPDSALAATWQRWLDDDHARLETGLRARSTLAEGAATRTAARLLPLLG